MAVSFRCSVFCYKVLDSQVWANISDLDQTAPMGLFMHYAPIIIFPKRGYGRDTGRIRQKKSHPPGIRLNT